MTWRERRVPNPRCAEDSGPVALSGRAPGSGCPGHGIAVLVAADRRLNFPAAGRGKAPTAGQRVSSTQPARHKAAACKRGAARREIAPQEHLRLCISTQIDDTATNNAYFTSRFTRIQVRAAPDASAFIKNQGRIQGSGWRAASKLLSPDREGSGRTSRIKLLSPDGGGPVLRPALCMSGHHERKRRGRLVSPARQRTRRA